MTWDDFDYWNTGEWQVIQEHLDDMEREGHVYCPSRDMLFAAMDAVEFDDVRVAILGQDPYPDPKFATGIAFSIPARLKPPYPVTLFNIFREYTSDLNYPWPKNGSLTRWCDQGVFLWNVIPTCEERKSLSHEDWLEWAYLTKEIVERLNKRNVVFVLLGGRARAYSIHIDDEISSVIETSHPSPRGQLKSKLPFLGSRIFSRVNDALCELKKEPIDWKL